ncbi:hypothetical protein JXB37_03980 [candidate division WOR-3 bacterium]|nr:hypothetical protein [candidate division WOR-3 bacterium]
MRTLVLVGVAFLLGAMAMGYIFQRDWSVRLTRVQEQQATRRRVLVDVRDSLRIEIDRRAGLARLQRLAGIGRSANGEERVSNDE